MTPEKFTYYNTKCILGFWKNNFYSMWINRQQKKGQGKTDAGYAFSPRRVRKQCQHHLSLKQWLKRNTTLVTSSKRGHFCFHSPRGSPSSWQRSAQSQFVSPRCKKLPVMSPEHRSQPAWAVGSKGVGRKQTPEGQLLGAGYQQKHLSPAGSWAG